MAGVALKVGISIDIKKRLLRHRESKQSRLKLKPHGLWANPDDVRSKQSVLAKHLYYDTAIARDCDLTTEAGRRNFLNESCFVVIEYKAHSVAKTLERERESSGKFRYVGKVKIRKA